MLDVVEELFQQGVELHKSGKVEVACQLYTAVLKAHPEHPTANHNMGVLAVDVGKVQEALPFFEAALEANADTAQFWLSYIDALINVERIADAQAVFDQAKNNGAKGDGFDQLEQRLKVPNQEPLESSVTASKVHQDQPNILGTLRLDQALRLAKRKSNEGSAEEAQRIYQDILVKFPKNKRAIDGLKGLARGPIGKASKVQEPPQDQQQSIINFYSQGRLQQALERAEVLMQQFPNSSFLYNICGAVYKELGQLDASVEAYNKAIAIAPHDAEVYSNMGNALKEQGKLEEAIEAYNKALAIKPDYAEAYYNMGNALQDQGKLEEAIEAYNKALAIKPDNAEAYSNMGATLQEQGKLEEAIEAYNKALAIKPDYAEAKHNLAETLKICSPKNNHQNPLIDLDNKIKAKHNKHALPKVDQELAAYTLNLLNELQSADKNLSTEHLQIYRRNNVDLNCKRHMQIFKEKEIIPKFCFGCYKVQVDVTTVLDLIRLAALFYESEFESNLSRKCLVEVRPNIPGSYKGLIYCQGIDQAHSVKTQLDVHVRDIDKNLVAKIKKGCSEFPLAFPKYGEVAASEEEMMQYPQEWQALENEFDAKNLISPKAYVNSSLKEFCLSDYLIMQKWIDYAKGIGDPTSQLFCGLPIKYGEIWKIAKARIKQ
jgi:tetratricopeptide (TPR) repeat protein